MSNTLSQHNQEELVQWADPDQDHLLHTSLFYGKIKENDLNKRNQVETVMSRSEALDIPQDLHMTLELVSQDRDELDLAVTNAIGREVVAALQADGYLVRLADRPTKTRGGELLIELIKVASGLAANPSANRDLYEHLLNDAGALVTICAGVVPALRFLIQQ